jgi:hypothetical protein
MMNANYELDILENDSNIQINQKHLHNIGIS